MKKSVKCLIMAFSVCAVSAFAVMASGCNGLKESINELRCDHVMVDGEVTKEPTCKEEGEMLKECTLCTYTETETLDKLKHAVVILKAVDPTCTKSGLTEGQKCADCDEILVAQKVVAPTGHKVVTDNAVEPTCSTVGKTEGSHCENCDTVFVEQKDVPMLEHVLKEMEAYGATCEEKGFTGGTKCENCDYATEGEIIPALGHSYDDGVVTTEATCEADGEKTYTCATCEGTNVEVIPALGHNYNEGRITMEATCDVDGIKTFTCLTCNAVKNEKIAAPGHNYVDGKCTVCEKEDDGCFVAGTPILMADGSLKSIEDVMPGDIVLTWNEETQQYDTGRVLNKILHQTYTIGRVTFADGTVVEVTPGHPIYTENGWKTLDAEEYPLLKVGDKVLSKNGEYDEVVSIEFITSEELVSVYNIEVEGEHTYFAGETSILAHNFGSK